jgi:hypothetical protein
MRQVYVLKLVYNIRLLIIIVAHSLNLGENEHAGISDTASPPSAQLLMCHKTFLFLAAHLIKERCYLECITFYDSIKIY